MLRAALPAFLGAAIIEIAACSMAGPPPVEYVLGTTPVATATTIPETGLPVIEVKRVQLPDYLDTTAILERSGNRLIPSSASRWGERLSVGMTRTLAASLAERLPGMVVTATPPLVRPAKQVLVDVEVFEPREGHQVVLVARWTLLDGASRQVLLAERASLVETVAGSGDSVVVEAMSRALDDLADQLATRIDVDRQVLSR